MFKSFGKTKDLGVLLARIGIGLTFIFIHGWPKISNPAVWGQLGGAMKNLGITWYPELWGFLAAFAEFGGGIVLIIGLFFRPMMFIMAFDMFVAAMLHFSNHDPWMKPAYPLELMAIFIGLMFIGAGKYSLDHLISKREKSPEYNPMISTKADKETSKKDTLRPGRTIPTT